MIPVDNLISAYVRLLIFQYQKPKAQQEIAIMVKQLLMDGVIIAVRDAYNPTTAVGPQLNVIGKYIGIPRTIGTSTPLPWFGFLRSGGGGNPNGMISISGAQNRNVVFFRVAYNGQRNTALSDTSYAFMMALKIILNSSDGTLASIDNYLNALIPGAVSVVDNLDMTLTYTVTGVLPVDPATLAAYLPKPMGVGINVRTNDFIVTDGGDFIVDDSGNKLVTS